MGKIIYIPASIAPDAPRGGWTFEYLSRNMEGYNYSVTYKNPPNQNKIDTKVYDLGGGQTITLTYSYTGNQITTMTFSGDTPLGQVLTKNLTYSGNKLTNVTYS